MRWYLLPIFALAALTALPWSQAAKYNLTRAVKCNLTVAHEPPDSNCLVPGVCFQVNQTIPGNSIWYWCGFYSTHKTIYYVKSNSATANFSGHWLMRKSKLDECVLPNIKTADPGSSACPAVPESSCSKKTTCQVRTFGLVFEDEICLVVVNNKTSNIVATVQVNNFYSRPRYYGTVFTIFITVTGLCCVLAKLAYDFYVGIVSPVNKHREPIRPKRIRKDGELSQDLVTNDDDAEKGKDGPKVIPDSSGGFMGRLRSLFTRQKHQA